MPVSRTIRGNCFISFPLFIELLKLLPHVEELRLEGIILASPDSTPHYTWQPIPLAFLALDFQALYRLRSPVMDAAAEHVRRLLSCFRDLKHLSLSGYQGAGLSMPPCGPLGSKLTTLSLDSCHASPGFFLDLESSSHFDRMVNFTWNDISGLSHHSIGGFLRYFAAIAPRLQSLCLSIASSIYGNTSECQRRLIK